MLSQAFVHILLRKHIYGGKLIFHQRVSLQPCCVSPIGASGRPQARDGEGTVTLSICTAQRVQKVQQVGDPS